MDFSSLSLPADVRLALAEAFWQHFGVLAKQALFVHWSNVKTFVRFADESAAVVSLADLNGDLLVRYVEWLNGQRRSNGQPWTKSSRSSTYTTLRTLLQWLERCRPEILGSIEYPFNPFPWRNRDSRPIATMSARTLRALLKACENDIKKIRDRRNAADAERASANGSLSTLGGLLNYIDQRFGGVVPPDRQLLVAEHYAARQALARFGGLKGVEPCLYPRSEALLPYYLAILIHAAGNPEPIAEIRCDCLQPLPLLHGPNPARREPSTCARCKNFAVSPTHRRYWLDQVDRHEALLHEPALPRQTLLIARSRLEEARTMIRAIDNATCKEGNHG